MDLLQPRCSCLQHHVRSTYVYTYQPRCTLNQGHHPSAEMYLRPTSTSIDQDVPSTEVDILQAGCTLFDEQQIPPRQKTVLRSPKTIRSTEDYKELGRDKEGPLKLK